MEDTELYKNAVSNLAEFYTHSYTEENAGTLIFETLNKIVPLEKGIIYLENSNGLEVKFEYGATDAQNRLRGDLFIKGCKFGVVEIFRQTIFSEAETGIFNTCCAIISAIIKDIELSGIIRMQVNALQEGIAEAKRQNKKIITSEKIKNTFLANVSHELRSPLNSILGFSELLQEQFIGKLNEKQFEYVSDIRIASLHLLGMINEVLDISKIEAQAMKLNLSQFSLRQNASEVLNILKPLYEKKKQTTILNIEDNLIIKADYQKMQQIFFNLISNAIKFTPQQGVITISAETASKNLTITVCDTGIGIEKKNHKKVFKKFVQIMPEASQTASTGLGLTITKELVNLHGGEIDLESELNKGSKFIIKFQNVVI